MSECNFEANEAVPHAQLQHGLPARDPQKDASHSLLRTPRSIADTGLPPIFVGRLVLKSTMLNGSSSFADLSQRHRLPIAVLEDIASRRSSACCCLVPIRTARRNAFSAWLP